ncbi:MAG: protein kinase [Deltaproteobacteria bacterium]|nr:protein kinase [Deltaproteobacteria bacterium]
MLEPGSGPTAAPPEAPSGCLPSGVMLDHFKILRMLGRGGMGEVYLARDTRLGRKVALKLVRPDALGLPDAQDRFLFEATATAQFQHPNIVTVYHVGRYQSRPYLALEHIDGRTVREWMETDRLAFKEALRVGLAVADAMQEAHRRRILHRDLKPENVLVGRDGRICVVDFGLARPIDRADDAQEAGADAADERGLLASYATRGDRTRGTPRYMAPEQWRRESLGPGTDIWALGMMLHELVAGRHPLEDVGAGRLPQIVAGPEPLPRLAQEAPAAFIDLIAACVSKDAAQRPCAADVAQVLRSLLGAEHRAPDLEESPFRGLLPFSTRNAGLFFGRDAEIAAVVERLRDVPVLPIVGGSGTGKSSFVMAGVIPRLQERGRWIVIRMRPGRTPFGELAMRVLDASSSDGSSSRRGGHEAARETLQGDEDADTADETAEESGRQWASSLLDAPGRLGLWLNEIAERGGARVLLFVDQLEELYTHVEDAETRRAFMEAICTAADDATLPVRVIFALRDDFLSRVADCAAARAVLGHATVMRTLGGEALRETLVRPLEALGYRFDPAGLSDEMARAVQGDAAALPLLQFAAEMLWERRDRSLKVISRAAYTRIGGVAGALAFHADGVLASLTPEQILVARSLLLRLVTSESTRRISSRSRLLEGLASDASQVLERLVASRLLVVRKPLHGGDADVELAHESLVRTWDRLRRWTEESREEIVLRGELELAAELWDKRGRRAEEAWQGDAVRDVTRRLGSTQLSELVRAFLAAGHTRSLQIRRAKLGAISGAFIVLAATAIALGLAYTRASTERRRAEEKRAEALLESAKTDLFREDFVSARGKLRAALEVAAPPQAHALWWNLERNPLQWRAPLPGFASVVDVTPDGHLVAVGGWDGAVSLYSSAGLQTRCLRDADDPIYAVAISPDGQRVAAGTRAGPVHLWNLDHPDHKVLAGHSDKTRALRFSSDGKLLATGSQDTTVRLWDIETGAARGTLSGSVGDVKDLAFGPSNALLASGSLDGSIRVWRLPEGTLRNEFHHDGRITAIAFDDEGKSIVSAWLGETVRIFDASDGTARKVEPVGVSVKRFFRTEDGHLSAAGVDAFNRVKTFGVNSDQPVRLTAAHPNLVSDLAIASSGRRAVTISPDNALRLWDLTRQPERNLGPHTLESYGIVFSADGQSVISGAADHSMRVWHVDTGEPVAVLRGHEDTVYSIDAIWKPRQLVVSGGPDRTIRLWNVGANEKGRLVALTDYDIRTVRLSRNGRWVAAGTAERVVRLWEVATGVQRDPLVGGSSSFYGLDFSPDLQTIAAGDDDGTIYLWNLETGKQTAVLTGHVGAVLGLSFRPDGRALASAGYDKTLRVWDLASRKGVVVGSHPGPVYLPDFHPDGNRIGVAVSDGTARIWNLKQGSFVSLVGHRPELNCIRFSPDGSRAATSSDDHSVRLWDTDSGRPIWHAPLMLLNPPRLYTHRGWVGLTSSKDSMDAPTPARSSWRADVELNTRGGRVSQDGTHLCLQSYSDKLRIWSTATDVMLREEPVRGIKSIQATPWGCLTLDSTSRAVLWGWHGGATTVSSRASAIGCGKERLLIAQDDAVMELERSGATTAIHPAKPGISALAVSGSDIIVGYRTGGLELLSPEQGHGPGTVQFEAVPPMAPEQMVEGPPGLVAVGFGDGLLGIWDVRTGTLVHRQLLHGPVAHLAYVGHELVAGTELGDHATISLDLFHRSRSELLKHVESRIRVTWVDGRIVELPCVSTPCGD